MGELQIAIIDRIVPKLCSNIANFDALERLKGVQITDRNNIRLHSIIILISNTASKDNCMGSLNTEITRPEFSSFDGGTVNHELISIEI